MPVAMRAIVAFDTYSWPSGDPTDHQRRALDRVDALSAAGGHARFVVPVASAAAYFVGPYAIEMGSVWRVGDLRSELERLGATPASRRIAATQVNG